MFDLTYLTYIIRFTSFLDSTLNQNMKVRILLLVFTVANSTYCNQNIILHIINAQLCLVRHSRFSLWQFNDRHCVRIRLHRDWFRVCLCGWVLCEYTFRFIAKLYLLARRSRVQQPFRDSFSVTIYFVRAMYTHNTGGRRRRWQRVRLLVVVTATASLCVCVLCVLRLWRQAVHMAWLLACDRTGFIAKIYICTCCALHTYNNNFSAGIAFEYVCGLCAQHEQRERDRNQLGGEIA